MGWLSAFSQFFSFINTIFTMMREKELRQQGYKIAKEEIEKRKQKTKDIADEIDSTPDRPDPWNGL